MTGRKLLSVHWILPVVGLALVAVLGGSSSLAAASEGAFALTTSNNLQTPGQAPAQPRPSGRGAAPSTLGWKWWSDVEVQKELGLSPEKVRNIDDYFNRRDADLRPVMHEFVKQSEELDKMTRAAVVDESTYLLQVMRVESTRQRLNESRTVMLYRMYRQLTPDQHRKLQDILDRRYSRGGRGRGAADAN